MKKLQGQEQLRLQVDYVDIVVSTATLWCVLYKGQYVQLKKDHQIKTETKYLPTSFSQRGSALRLAAKLNAMFNTQDFEARQIPIKTP